jgi:hypothetical protein
MKEGSFIASRAGRIFSTGGFANPCIKSIWSELVETLAALIFLITKLIFAVAVKFLRIVAFRT